MVVALAGTDFASQPVAMAGTAADSALDAIGSRAFGTTAAGESMTLYTLRNLATGATIQTTDPGRALVTGKWADIGKFKGPTLRALAARAPYFHNAFAKDLPEVVNFYNTRFNIGLTQQEQDDIVAFLKTL